MKITKQRLKEIIREELNEADLPTWEGEPFGEYDLEAENEKGRAASLADLQSDEKFTGGSPQERLLTLMRAREVLAAMSKEELTALSKSLDAAQVAVLRHILANPMYAPTGDQGHEMELEEQLTIPRGTAEEYKQGLRALIAKHGIEKVTRAYKNAGGSNKQTASMQALKKML